MKYNHIGKYCKTKQQVCAPCGEKHRMDQCAVGNDAVKCCNCKGNYLATSNDCSYYREQVKIMLNLINRYSATSKPVILAPAIYNTREFPPLPNVYQQQKEILQNNPFDDILNALTSKMETIIEETTNRLFKVLQKKITKIEKSISTNDNNDKNEDVLTMSDSDSNEESQVVKYIKNKQKQKSETINSITSSIATSAKPTTTTNVTTSKPPRTQKKQQSRQSELVLLKAH
ncbi:unnamed protein product [Rotaria sp. Silwood2]|nr:unnamed protein product [Rotaria sp. Silwood2]CAF2965269.1 unnamed protein product [Rotaria sp. Silwood2]CAF4034205.1 unnamed protein product [Rotaria sp. Silwood2]CAF4152563.1 unnamed protein product [Rotaria sp. Silwood2]